MKRYLIWMLVPMFLFAKGERLQNVEKEFTFQKVEKEILKQYPVKGKDEERKTDMSGVLYDITHNKVLTLEHIVVFHPIHRYKIQLI